LNVFFYKSLLDKTRQICPFGISFKKSRKVIDHLILLPLLHDKLSFFFSIFSFQKVFSFFFRFFSSKNIPEKIYFETSKVFYFRTFRSLIFSGNGTFSVNKKSCFFFGERKKDFEDKNSIFRLENTIL